MNEIVESHNMGKLITEAIFVGYKAPVSDAFIIYLMTYNWGDQVRADIIRQTIVAGQIARSVYGEKPSVRLMRPVQ